MNKLVKRSFSFVVAMFILFMSVNISDSFASDSIKNVSEKGNVILLANENDIATDDENKDNSDNSTKNNTSPETGVEDMSTLFFLLAIAATIAFITHSKKDWNKLATSSPT